jgi:hypothetical protein
VLQAFGMPRRCANIPIKVTGTFSVTATLMYGATLFDVYVKVELFVLAGGD